MRTAKKRNKQSKNRERKNSRVGVRMVQIYNELLRDEIRILILRIERGGTDMAA